MWSLHVLLDFSCSSSGCSRFFLPHQKTCWETLTQCCDFKLLAHHKDGSNTEEQHCTAFLKGKVACFSAFKNNSNFSRFLYAGFMIFYVWTVKIAVVRKILLSSWKRKQCWVFIKDYTVQCNLLIATARYNKHQCLICGWASEVFCSVLLRCNGHLQMKRISITRLDVPKLAMMY